MVFITDSGREYAFDHREFRKEANGDPLRWLSVMMNIINRYDPAIVRCQGIENLDKVVADRNLTAAETKLLYQLFGQ